MSRLRVSVGGGRMTRDGPGVEVAMSRAFTGWPEKAFDVLIALDGEPGPAELEEHRADRERLVLEPMEGLCSDLADAEPALGDCHVWRLHRSAWLWQHQCAGFTLARRMELFLRFDLDGLDVEASWMRADPGQLERFRSAVADDPSGAEIVPTLRAGGYVIAGDVMVRVPRGFPAPHRGDSGAGAGDVRRPATADRLDGPICRARPVTVSICADGVRVGIEIARSEHP